METPLLKPNIVSGAVTSPPFPMSTRAAMTVLCLLLTVIGAPGPVNTEAQRPCSSQRLQPIESITELKPCDILVKPNHNWLPGTTWAPGGRTFGHAVIVANHARDSVLDRLLRKVEVYESQSRDVPGRFQVRRVRGISDGNDFRYANDSWSRSEYGYRYRLRLHLTEKQRQSVLQFLEIRTQDRSSWRASKVHGAPFKGPAGTEDHAHSKRYSWYCSLLIWQAFYTRLGIDLDANAGRCVYPNDLINCPAFDGDRGHRVRF